MRRRPQPGWLTHLRNQTPFAHVRITPASKAGLLVERAILTRSVSELWGTGATYEELHNSIRSTLPNVWDESYGPATFKFIVEAFHGKRTLADQRRIIDTFQFMPLLGEIDLKNPDLTFCLFEAYHHPEGKKPRTEPFYLYFGRLVGTGSRTCVDKYDLKKRPYIGTTSMDAELTLITANMALCAPGKLAYDPFVGTGSFMVACAHFGSISYGSDIDGRMIRGKKGRNIVNNFKHYDLMSCFGDCFVSDLTNTPIRSKPWLDSIVCDPPYGIREGLKVLGNRDPAKEKGVIIRDGVARHLMPDYIPPKRPYGFEAMMNDILDFSVDNLLEDGRLCMWMPTANDELETYALPSHPVLDLLHVCVQDFGNCMPSPSVSRRILIREQGRDNCLYTGGKGAQRLTMLCGSKELKIERQAKISMGLRTSSTTSAQRYVVPRFHWLDTDHLKYFQGFKTTQEQAEMEAGEVVSPAGAEDSEAVKET